MERMSTLDAGFFFVEHPNAPLHLGVLCSPEALHPIATTRAPKPPADAFEEPAGARAAPDSAPDRCEARADLPAPHRGG